MAEWLRRWTRNPLGFTRAGSNPADYVPFCFHSFLFYLYQEYQGFLNITIRILVSLTHRNLIFCFMATKLSDIPHLLICSNLLGRISQLKLELLSSLLSSAQLYRTSILTEEDITQGALYLTFVLEKGAALEKTPGVFLLSGNEICRYILSNSPNAPTSLQETVHVSNWIEFESTSVFPHILKSLTSGSLSEPLKSSLKNLEANYPFSPTDALSLSDVIMLSSLQPLLAHSALSSQLAESCPKLVRWGSSASLKSALSRLPPVSEWTVPSQGRTLSQNPTPASDNLSGEYIQACMSKWRSGQVSLLSPDIHHPVLPRPDRRNIMISSALPYVNNVPHLGNIIGCVLSADVFARYCRARGYQTLYLCGTDEYGTATEIKAVKEGVTPREVCDRFFKEHKQIYDWFGISFDTFGRTTTEKQTEIAQNIFWKLQQRGLITSDVVAQLYCRGCERFLADRFVSGVCPSCRYDDAQGDQCDKCSKLINAVELSSPRCKLCREEPIVKESEHIFLDMEAMQPSVQAWVDTASTAGKWSSNACSITRNWFKEGLRSRCISRDLRWGTPVPLEGFRDKVFYVWFDAPIGYISITACYTPEWERWWKAPDTVQLYQFMAKDNVPFHTVMFPACLLSTGDGYTLLHHISACEYLNYEGGKFSKSRGVGVFGDSVQETSIPSDIYRFYLLYVRPETQDTTFSWSDLMVKNNNELLNNLGNFVNRALSFTKSSFKGVVPPLGQLEEGDRQLIGQVNAELGNYINTLEEARIRDGIKFTLNLSRLGNGYIQDNQPWVLIKQGEEGRARAGSIMNLSINLVCLVMILLQPYMPQTCASIRQQLNLPNNSTRIPEHFAPYIPAGHSIGKPVPLFKKFEQTEIDSYQEKFLQKQNS